ncbi:MAG: haloacid dehalogenase-like hydrolase, partial [Alphaproteobacteria bacterium]|nr:haloacid dehalogenase-like hydrolase [Alphaproteobacteria bacterium]
MAAALIIDFDSTLVAAETLEVLAEVALAEDSQRQAKAAEVARITDAAMAGELEFGEALRLRLGLLRPTREQVAQAAERLKGRITPSVRRNQTTLAAQADRIWVISGGFHEVVE